MNIRDKLLSSKLWNFEKTDISWHESLILKMMNLSFKNKSLAILSDTEIYIGLTKQPLIFLNDLNLDKTNLDPDFLIFASRHTSKTGRPAFLVHTTGNWDLNNGFGGEAHDLSLTSAILHKAGFISLIEAAFLPKFSIDIEVTHHGPTVLEKPLIFMELGSSKKEWRITEAGELVANAIIKTIFKYLEYKNKNNLKIGLGFGGTHYAPNFIRLIKNNNVAVSFICPKYYIKELTTDLIDKMIRNTYEKVDYFIIDWKGTNSAQKKHLLPILEQYNIPIKKTKDF